MARFMNYYSYKLHEVGEIEARDFEYLYEIMEKAKAMEDINELDLISYPHVKPDVARKIHKSLYKRAMPEKEKVKKVVTVDDLLANGFKGI